MGGTPKRMENFAHFIMNEIGYKLPAGTQLQDISAFSYRYSMYKVKLDTFYHTVESIERIKKLKMLFGIVLRLGRCYRLAMEWGHLQ